MKSILINRSLHNWILAARSAIIQKRNPQPWIDNLNAFELLKGRFYYQSQDNKLCCNVSVNASFKNRKLNNELLYDYDKILPFVIMLNLHRVTIYDNDGRVILVKNLT